MWVQFIVELHNSTIANNHVFGADSIGGGIYLDTGYDQPNQIGSLISNSIITGNTDTVGNPDLRPGFSSNATLNINYSLIGDTTGLTTDQLALINAGTGNLLDMDPLLGPLADNGGTTKTHALLPGSPALDAGDPGFDSTGFDPLLYYDQRGSLFFRINNAGNGSIVDMGAYESQGVPNFATGDYNRDGLVDTADYTFWLDSLGRSVTEGEGADGNGDGTVNQADYGIWKSNFGQGLEFGSGGSASAEQVVAAAVSEPTEATFDTSALPPLREAPLARSSGISPQFVDPVTPDPEPGRDELLLMAALERTARNNASAASPAFSATAATDTASRDEALATLAEWPRILLDPASGEL